MKKHVLLYASRLLQRAWLVVGRELVRGSALVGPRRYVTLLGVERVADGMRFVEGRTK